MYIVWFSFLLSSKPVKTIPFSEPSLSVDLFITSLYVVPCLCKSSLVPWNFSKFFIFKNNDNLAFLFVKKLSSVPGTTLSVVKNIAFLVPPVFEK